MRNKYANAAIVIGGNHINTLGTIRSLGEMGITVYGIVSGYKHNFIEYSRYLKNFWVIPTIDKNIINICEKILFNEKIKPVIFPCSDDAIFIIDKNINRLINRFIFPNISNKEGKISYYMDKQNMVDCAKKTGLITPKTKTIVLSSPYNSLSEISFPCIIKPSTSNCGSKYDIEKIKSLTSLYKRLDYLKDKYDKMIIQEYIQSDDSIMLEIIGCTLSNGQIYIPGILEKMRHYPNKDSSGSYFRISKNRFNLNYNLIRDYFLNIGYKGIFDIEFKYSDNKCYFIEVNFRNGGTNYLYTKSNANIPYIWFLDSINKLENQYIKDAKIGKFCMYEERDWKNIGTNISFIKWVSDLFKTDVFTTFNIMDIKPFFVRLINKVLLNRK